MHPRFPLLALWALMALCVLPEVVLQGADLGIWGAPDWRGAAYGSFGFWPGLLYDWRPNYRLQPLAMFVTYGFLHVGALHMVVNMITLWSLGRAVLDRAGGRGFLALYAASLLGGGMGFGLLTNTTIPMVGASGALFGLIGGVLVWAVIDRRREGLTLWPVGRAVLGLVALNAVLWFVAGGQLAWQTHLGGLATGAAMALLMEWRSPVT
jgi:rhomboid protease GluP